MVFTRLHFVTATGVEFGLNDHVGYEMGSFASRLEKTLNFGLGGDVSVVLEMLSDLNSRSRQHNRVASERFPRRSQERSVCAQCFFTPRTLSLSLLNFLSLEFLESFCRLWGAQTSRVYDDTCGGLTWFPEENMKVIVDTKVAHDYI